MFLYNGKMDTVSYVATGSVCLGELVLFLNSSIDLFIHWVSRYLVYDHSLLSAFNALNFTGTIMNLVSFRFHMLLYDRCNNIWCLWSFGFDFTLSSFRSYPEVLSKFRRSLMGGA